MKTIIKLMIFTFSLISCKAQTIPMNNAHAEIPNGAYIKDTEYYLNNFIGTWEYQNGLENFTVILKKQENYSYDAYTTDILYGEYKYVDNLGEELINTLNEIDLNTDKSYRNISGATFKVNGEFPICNDCNVGEIRVKSYFDDAIRDYLSLAISLRYIGPTQIKIRLYRDGKSFYINGNSDVPEMPTVPFFEYTMNKIN